MNLLENLANFKEVLSDLWSTFIDMITSAVEALATFHVMLQDFDNRIIAMTDSCGTAEFEGLPIVEAVSMYRYLVGDIVFYLMYLLVLFGCLFTVFKLVALIYMKFTSLVNQMTGNVTGTGSFGTLLTKLFK